MKRLILLGVLALAGCATAPVRTVDGAWMISAQVPFTGPNGALSDAIDRANAFCASQGQVAKLVSNDSRDCMLHGGCGQAQVKFICAAAPVAGL